MTTPNFYGNQETRISNTKDVYSALWFPEIRIVGTTLTTSFGDPISFGSPNALEFLYVTNTTNQPISLSFNGVYPSVTIPSNQTFQHYFLANVRSGPISFAIKADVVPTSGDVIINGYS